jgi:PKHD-type hydroxylase
VFTFIKNLKLNYDISTINETKLLQYNTGGKYDWHQDVLWSQKLHRKFTYIIQLSEKNEYTGGDFEFRDAKHIDMKHARDVGTMIVFPSILYHRVTPLIKGQRHSIVGWVVGPQWK